MTVPSKHRGHPTIAFRPDYKWQYDVINERARLSGHTKKDFITRSCIYSNICVVGTAENVQRIVAALYETQQVMREVVGQMESGDFSMSEEGFEDMRSKMLATLTVAVDIINGAAYMFDKHCEGEMAGERFLQLKKALEADLGVDNRTDRE